MREDAGLSQDKLAGAAGLTANLELNLGRYDPTPVRPGRRWKSSWRSALPSVPI